MRQNSAQTAPYQYLTNVAPPRAKALNISQIWRPLGQAPLLTLQIRHPLGRAPTLPQK